MLRISEKGEEIIIRDIPLKEIFVKAVWIAATSYVVFFASNRSAEFIYLRIAGLIGLILELYRISFIEVNTVKINKQKRLVSVNNRSLVKNTDHIYRFGEIADLISVETLRDKKYDQFHRLVFTLETGEIVELAGAVTSGKDKRKYIEAANIVNHLIFDDPKQIPQNFTGFNKF